MGEVREHFHCGLRVGIIYTADLVSSASANACALDHKDSSLKEITLAYVHL